MKATGARRPRMQILNSLLDVLVVAGCAALALATPKLAEASEGARAVPIVFVHGFAGSATQYASVAKRFASNGFPADRIRTFEYDSSNGPAIAAAPTGLDALIDDVRAEFGVDQVNLVGHSLGTSVSNTYLSVPARAAKIARYVGVDGSSNTTTCIGNPNLRCMGIFRGTAGNVGNNNLYLNFTQSHVEAATSPESFAAQYRFFLDQEPKTTLVLPEPPGRVEVAGRAVNFPPNTGVDGGTLLIWEVNGATGHRVDTQPVAVFDLGPTGEWGPAQINGQQHYEFELLRPDSPRTLHLYYQPFLRSDYWVRLLSSSPTSPIVLNTITGPNHAAVVVTRNREWWTTDTNIPPRNDVLEVGTRSPGRGDQAPDNVLTNVKGNAIGVSTTPVGLHLHDNPADGVSSLALIPFFAAQAFQSGVDVYMPATTPPDGTITFRSSPRGDTTRPQVVNVPNWASDAHRITVTFNDYVQDINSWGECKRAKPSPCK